MPIGEPSPNGATIGLEGSPPMVRARRTRLNLNEDRERAELIRVLWSRCLAG